MGEINPGVWDGLSPELARERYPDEWDRFLKDPYSHRAPRAESYHDLSGTSSEYAFVSTSLRSNASLVRLEPVIVELEREQNDLLIIGHASVIRCLLAYLIGLPASEVPAVEIARGDLVEVVPASYGVHSQAFHFWSGPGRSHDEGDETGTNYYENYAEGEWVTPRSRAILLLNPACSIATSGKKKDGKESAAAETVPQSDTNTQPTSV